MDAVSGLLILDDASLVRRAQGGDRAAFSALVERHYGLAHGCAYRRTGNRADAEDIAQDVMAKLGSAIFSLKEPAALRGFLLRLTINAVTDFFRKRAREARGNTAYFTDPSVQADEAEEDLDADAALWAAVRKLPDQQRDAVLLVYADGASHREAARGAGLRGGDGFLSCSCGAQAPENFTDGGRSMNDPEFDLTKARQGAKRLNRAVKPLMRPSARARRFRHGCEKKSQGNPRNRIGRPSSSYRNPSMELYDVRQISFRVRPRHFDHRADRRHRRLSGDAEQCRSDLYQAACPDRDARRKEGRNQQGQCGSDAAWRQNHRHG